MEHLLKKTLFGAIGNKKNSEINPCECKIRTFYRYFMCLRRREQNCFGYWIARWKTYVMHHCEINFLSTQCHVSDVTLRAVYGYGRWILVPLHVPEEVQSAISDEDTAKKTTDTSHTTALSPTPSASLPSFVLNNNASTCSFFLLYFLSFPYFSIFYLSWQDASWRWTKRQFKGGDGCGSENSYALCGSMISKSNNMN